MFEIGQQIDGQYLVVEKYRGRRWILYVAQDRISEKVFVIKRPSKSFGEAACERFRKRAKIWIDIGKCDEIATAYMTKDFEGIPHLFIEYLTGPSLADVLCSRPGKPLPINQTLALTKQLISGMKFLHGASFPEAGNAIHGNLCPRNILTESGNIKITDIGLASALRHPAAGRKSWCHMESAPCLAPEQIKSPGQENALSDIYCFGVLMYEVATGTTPTIMKALGDPMSGLVASGPVPPSMRNRRCPRWLEETILKCMAREPENRFQSFAHIETLVNEIPEAEEIPADPAEKPSPSKRTSRVARVRGVAKKQSSQLNHYYLGVEHMMLGILAEEEGMVLSAFDDKVTAEKLRSEILSSVPDGEGPWHWEGIRKTPRYRRIMKKSRQIRRQYADERMLPQHILLAILEEGDNVPVRVLSELDIDIRTAVEKLRRELARRRPAILVTESGVGVAHFAYKISCVSGGPYYTPFVGRSRELERAQDLLLTDGKSIMLVAESGVGKTVFAQQLGCAISETAASSGLKYGSMLKLRTAALLASGETGEKLLEDFADTLDEIVDSNSIVLIEDLPMLLGASIKMPPRAAADALEEYITSKGLLMVATATPQSYALCEPDYAGLIRTLEIVNLREPSSEEAFEILGSAKEAFEIEHSVKIGEDAIKAALSLSTAPRQRRALPACALELLDQACMAAKLSSRGPEESGGPVNVTAEQVKRFLSGTAQTESIRQSGNPEAYP